MLVDAPGEGELRLSGPRVVIPESKAVIVPWSERIRYGIKKNGYHGGVAPQEMVIPIAVLSPSDTFPEGWVEVAVDVPSWWEEPVAGSAVSVAAPVANEACQASADGASLQRGRGERASDRTEGGRHRSTAGWVGDLFRSPIFEQQKKLAGRSVPSDDVLRSVLTALDQRGGRMTSAALARVGELPTDAASRAPGRDAASSEHRRVCGVDERRGLGHGGSESRASEASVRPEVRAW